ncbi:MAG: RNA polymerase sigma factor [Bacteroidia bacterium]|nr:RNA polymerase sigma factor [Winogradskyella sp.]MBT8376885.1 RNA polymerase sigma factor [Bacteroidia bacterium]
MSLDGLIKNCIKQNAEAQSQLYKLYSVKLFSLCLKYSNNYAEAEDVLHDAFITIFNKIDQYKGKGSFEGWLKRITINTALQRYRKTSVLELVNEDKIAEVSVDIDDLEINVDYLLSIIQELPDRYRLVFNLYVLDGYSHKEVAELMQISVGTSKSNLARARAILKEKIEDYRANNKSQLL